MANTYVDYTGDGSETDFNFTFPYIKTAHVAVEINEGPTGGLNKWVRKTLTTDYSVQTSPTTFVRFVTAPANNVKVRVLRDSEANIGIVDFANGSVLTETELDNAYEHNRYLAQEAEEGIGGGSLSKKGGDHYNADGLKIENIAAPENDGDAVNKGYADGRYVNETGDTMTGALTLNADPTANLHASTKQYVDNTDSARKTYVDNAIATEQSARIAGDNDQVSKTGDTMSGNLAMGGNKVTGLGSPGTGTDAANKTYVDNTVASVTAGTIPDGTIITSKIADDAVTAAKLDNTGVTADSYTNADITVDENGRITAAANGSSGAGATNLGNTPASTNVEITSSTGTNTTVAGATTSLAGVMTGADKTKLNGIETGATANSSDATLLARANHTGTQTAATISDFDTAVADNTAVAANTAKVSNATHTGDVTGSTALAIANDVVTFAKMQNINTAKVIGRTTAGSGDPEEVSILDEDTMSSDSATSLATQQSIKAYVDANTVSKFSTGFVNTDGTTAVGSGATMTFTHNLGTANLVWSVSVAQDATGTGEQGQDYVFWNDTAGTNLSRGIQIAAVSSTQITIQLAPSPYRISTNGLYDTWTWGTGTNHFSHIKLTVIG